MKTEKQIKALFEKYKEEYVSFMNGAGKFTPKHKYSLQGKLEVLVEILEEKE